MIDRFKDKYSFLSNFYPAETMYDGVLYPTSEHAYIAAKTLSPTLRAHITTLTTPGADRHYGRRLDLRPDWEDVKLGIMHQIVRDKFIRNPELREKLLATGDDLLIEGNTWGDTFWGCVGGEGENHLGKILMKVRWELGHTGPKREGG